MKRVSLLRRLNYTPEFLVFRLESSRKRPRSPESTHSYAEIRTSMHMVAIDCYQIVRSAGIMSLRFDYSKTFATLLTAGGSVFIDNTHALEKVAEGRLLDPTSRTCILFASSSSFAAQRFYSTIAFGFDLNNSEQILDLVPYLAFFRALKRCPEYTTLVFDFTTILGGEYSGPRWIEQTSTVTRSILAYISKRLQDFVYRYKAEIDLSEHEPEKLVRTFLDTLQRKHDRPLLVCLHGLESVLERAQVCSLWEQGTHAAISTILDFVDRVLLAPLADSHTQPKGIVQKIIITGAQPQVYLDDTAFERVEVHDISLSREAYSLHGYYGQTVQRALKAVRWNKDVDEEQQKLVVDAALDCADRPCRGDWTAEIDVVQQHLLVDPRTPGVAIAVLKDGGVATSTGQTIIPTVQLAFARLIPYEPYARILFPLLRQHCPAWLREILLADEGKRVLVPATKTEWIWAYRHLRSTPRPVSRLSFAALATTGLIRLLGWKDGKWVVEVGGQQAARILNDILAEVDKFERAPPPPLYAQISAEQATAEALQDIVLLYLDDILPTSEAHFQEHFLVILRWILQHNGQCPQQAQPEFWLRCGNATKCRDRRGDVVLLLRMADGSWRVFIYELKYFALEATRKATLEAVQRPVQSSGRSTEYFVSELERVKLLSGWKARKPRTLPPDFLVDDPNRLTIPDLKAEYKYKNEDEDEVVEGIKSAVHVAKEVPKQGDHYLGGAIQGVREELGNDTAGFADARFTNYEAASATMAVTFVAISFLLIGNILLYANEGARADGSFRPVVAGAFPWTSDPTFYDVQNIRNAKAASRPNRPMHNV